MQSKIYTRVLALLLTITSLLSFVSCNTSVSIPTLSDPDENTIVENTIKEKELTEEILTEHITSEIYLEEIVVAEEKITELLLEEESISEVVLCNTIYVSQDNLDEFAQHSQMSELFDNIDFLAVLKKIAVGTGVIVTLVVLKKVGLPDQRFASMVVAAASESMKFSTTGAAIGSLYGGLSGTANTIDKTGRTSAVIGFATATAGLVLSTISLVTTIPTGGASSITAGVGIKLVIAGVSVISSTIGTVMAAKNAVKKFTTTDAVNIDWDNIDWNLVGASAAQKAIENSADGYMWGSIIGAIKGGATGYENYEKFSANYTEYTDRIKGTPVNGDRGEWSGERGESDFVLKKAITCKNGQTVQRITYKNGVVDFSKYAEAQVTIPNMTDNRSASGDGNFAQADKACAEKWTQLKHMGKTWEAKDVKAYRESNNLTWHEMNNMKGMQLVPSEVNATFDHYGGVAEYNAMMGQKGVTDFD